MQRVFEADPRRAFVLALGASAVAPFIALAVWTLQPRPPWVESTYWPRDHSPFGRPR